MAHVTFIDPIDTLSGKIAKSHKTTYMLRSAPTSNKAMIAKPVFTMVRRKRRTPLTQDEMAFQERFGNICKATIQRMKDPGKVMQDQVAFKAQNRYTTFRQYVWNQCADEYDSSN
jgi:hypothetical protein